MNIDDRYLQSIDEGDLGAAEKIVETAAHENGFIQRAYHGTDRGEFAEFREIDKPNRDAFYGKGFYFAETREDAKSYTGDSLLYKIPYFGNKAYQKNYGTDERYRDNRRFVVYSVFLDLGDRVFDMREFLDKPLGEYLDFVSDHLLDDNYRENRLIELQSKKQKYGKELMRDRMFLRFTNWVDYNKYFAGYTGLCVLSEPSPMMRSTYFVVRKPNQIKSAEVIVRDAAGEIIPPSRRFNKNSNSIYESIYEYLIKIQ